MPESKKGPEDPYAGKPIPPGKLIMMDKYYPKEPLVFGFDGEYYPAYLKRIEKGNLINMSE